MEYDLKEMERYVDRVCDTPHIIVYDEEPAYFTFPNGKKVYFNCFCPERQEDGEIKSVTIFSMWEVEDFIEVEGNTLVFGTTEDMCGYETNNEELALGGVLLENLEEEKYILDILLLSLKIYVQNVFAYYEFADFFNIDEKLRLGPSNLEKRKIYLDWSSDPYVGNSQIENIEINPCFEKYQNSLELTHIYSNEEDWNIVDDNKRNLLLEKITRFFPGIDLYQIEKRIDDPYASSEGDLIIEHFASFKDEEFDYKLYYGKVFAPKAKSARK